MKIAIASGKGGTGKTTIALGLSNIMPKNHLLLDCDVEAPDCSLFITSRKEDKSCTEKAFVSVPVVDNALCTACGICRTVCRFNALALIKNRVLVFNELCHGCEVCFAACPEKAITMKSFPIGKVVTSFSINLRGKERTLRSGYLDPGKPLAPPIIKKVKDTWSEMILIDSPPGTACTMVASVFDCDVVILAAEESLFGVHDLNLAVKTVRLLDIPMAVISNKWNPGDSLISEYCNKENLSLLAVIPEDDLLRVLLSNGKLPENEDCIFYTELQRVIDDFIVNVECRTALNEVGAG